MDVRGSGASGVELIGYGGYKFVGCVEDPLIANMPPHCLAADLDWCWALKDHCQHLGFVPELGQDVLHCGFPIYSGCEWVLPCEYRVIKKAPGPFGPGNAQLINCSCSLTDAFLEVCSFTGSIGFSSERTRRSDHHSRTEVAEGSIPLGRRFVPDCVHGMDRAGLMDRREYELVGACVVSESKRNKNALSWGIYDRFDAQIVYTSRNALIRQDEIATNVWSCLDSVQQS